MDDLLVRAVHEELKRLDTMLRLLREHQERLEQMRREGIVPGAAEKTPFKTGPFLLGEHLLVYAPKDWTDPHGTKWAFSHWKLGYRDLFGFLRTLTTSNEDPWIITFDESLKDKPGLTLDAVYERVEVEPEPVEGGGIG